MLHKENVQKVTQNQLTGRLLKSSLPLPLHLVPLCRKEKNKQVQLVFLPPSFLEASCLDKDFISVITDVKNFALRQHTLNHFYCYNDIVV